ncbi:hypothetical protein F5X99DRAFT_92545 [Biscogniauxia marginata]|nr:hypothetical protein F5X99DRAFT_92545 [Biscogniauxia marginata]
MATTGSISDDWQEVENDAFSVVSLPTSEDAPLASSRGPPESPTRSHASESLLRLPIRPKYPDHAGLESESDSDNSTERDDDVERYGMDTKDVEPRNSAEGHLSDILDVDIDPNVLYQATASLIKLITEIVALINLRGDTDALVGAGKIKAECSTLIDRLSTLQPILQGYSKHWKSEGNTVEIPIDPGLYEWMAGLRVELLGLQAIWEVQSHPLGLSSSGQSWDSSSAKRYLDILADSSSQIEAFMPVLQADYEDFHTAHLPVLSIWDADAAHPAPRNGGPPLGQMAPGSNLALLRRELYALKDQITASIGEFEVPKKNGASGDTDVPVDLMEVMNSYHTIKSSMDVMLSNHASDWIEYSLAGGLTYPEFCRLNPDTIRSLNLQLKELTDELNAELNRVHSLRYLNDPDDLLQDEKPTFKKSVVDGFSTIEKILRSLFQIHKPAPAPAPIQQDGQ